jgi:hypothetical protein
LARRLAVFFSTQRSGTQNPETQINGLPLSQQSADSRQRAPRGLQPHLRFFLPLRLRQRSAQHSDFRLHFSFRPRQALAVTSPACAASPRAVAPAVTTARAANISRRERARAKAASKVSNRMPVIATSGPDGAIGDELSAIGYRLSAFGLRATESSSSRLAVLPAD